MQHSVQARWVVPMDRPPIEGGVVSMEQGRIVGVGGRANKDAHTVDLGDVALLPGLINAHTHLEFSHLDRPLGEPGMSLPEWIRAVIATRRGSDEPAAAICRGLHECLRCGVTTVVDIANTSLQTYAQCEESPHLVLLHEVLGFSAARAESRLVDVGERLAELMPSPSQLLSIGVSPHAPYSVHPKLVEDLIALAARQNLPVAMHLAESLDEINFLATGQGGFKDLLVERSMWDDTAVPKDLRPLDYLQLLARAPRALVVHGNYLRHDEIEFVASHRNAMTVVFCPRTHCYFRHESYPLAELRAAGARVVLGTDSRASNPDLNLLAEARDVTRRWPAIPAADVLEMITSQAAIAIGIESEYGTLTAGKRANLAALPCNASQDPVTAILREDQRPTAVWIDGCEVLKT